MSTATDTLHPAARLTPGVVPEDPVLAFWLGQASLRLRRETSWCWFQRSGREEPGSGKLPPVTDPAVESLDLVRYEGQKRAFFEQDPTARYLTECLAGEQPPAPDSAPGGFGHLAETLDLDDGERFVLALGLLGRLDAAAGPVISACMNDMSRPWPTLALAQRLWDDPMAVARISDPGHPLRRLAVLRFAGDDLSDWQRPIRIHPAVARTLVAGVDEQADGLPARLVRVLDEPLPGMEIEAAMTAERVRMDLSMGVRFIPLVAPKDSDFDRAALAVTQRLGTRLAGFAAELVPDGENLLAAATVCWLAGFDLLLPEGWENRITSESLSQLLDMPLRVFAPAENRTALNGVPAQQVLPARPLPSFDFHQRRELINQRLGKRKEGLRGAVDECARRFRMPPRALRRAVDTVVAGDRESGILDGTTLMNACRHETETVLGELAQLVRPRFLESELVLPADQWRQYREIVDAMKALTAVHYEWGAANAWNHAGLAVMFAGAPGTGKTMAAEALAASLDLPMYRVDLSQIINKYIGETEKNLKRVFDAAESSDCLMFFDECDALFGKRMDPKHSNDRFANIEISYLLERMERFKGLAVLATNRRRDLDEAFTRRLRYIVEFPVPGETERERIWRQSFPPNVAVDSIDFRYIASQFPVTGGHIRSIALNASLQAAARHGAAARRVDMPELLVAVKRELEKMNRAADVEQFGRYRQTLEEALA